MDRPRGGGAARRNSLFRGGAWPEVANLGLPGVNPARVWVGWHLRGMRKPLEAKAGLGRAWAGLATARGGLRGGASPARACRGCWGAPQATLAGREGRASGGGPHRGSNRAWGSCRGPGGEDRRRVAAALAEKVAAGVVAEGSGSGKLLAVTEESKRCVDGAPVRRRGVAAAAQRSALLGGAARRGATARVYGGALLDWERRRGVVGGIYRVAERPWRACPGRKARRESRRAGRGRCARKGTSLTAGPGPSAAGRPRAVRLAGGSRGAEP